VRVSELGEDALLARITARLDDPAPGEVWTGDDAAVVAAPEERCLLTTDLLVEGLDFELAWFTGADVGWKSLAVNASDIAAMGGLPRHAVAALALRQDASVDLVDGIVDGMRDACRCWGVTLVGGDISGGSDIAVSVAMTGAVARPVLRSGARVGDEIFVTGSLGGAASGLAALRAGVEARARFPTLVERQLRPRARVDAGVALARAGATAMIDVSDGLAVDLARLLEASGVGCAVDPDEIPIDEGVMALARAYPEIVSDPLEAALLGGEDYELLFTIEATEGRAPLEEVSCTRIGTIVAGAARVGGRELDEWRGRGWQHLQSP
jgi:thiamine-monophosphate kinase